MPTALAGHRLEIRSPRRLEARAGEEISIELDIELAEPWIQRLALGKAVRSIDGHASSGLVLCFECPEGTSVPALVSGTARTTDTRIDVHTPEGFPDAGAGHGVEVEVVASSGLSVTYGHLARGSTKSGLIRAGETIGASGNTGRCVDGCHKSFVRVEVTNARLSRTFDELTAPIEVELLLDGKVTGRAAQLPAGEMRIQGFKAGRVRVPRDTGKGACALEVKLVRKRSLIASLRESIKVQV